MFSSAKNIDRMVGDVTILKYGSNAYYLKGFWIFLIAGFVFLLNLRLDGVGFSFLLSLLIATALLVRVAIGAIRLISVYYLFSILFFCLLPWLHYSLDSVIWIIRPLESSTIIKLNIIISVSNLITYATYAKAFRKYPAKNIIGAGYSIKDPPYIRMIAASTFGFVGLFALYDFSLGNLLIRELLTEHDSNFDGDSAVLATLSHVFRFLPVFSAYLCLAYRTNKFVRLYLFTILVVSVFPTGVARHLVAFVYVPLTLVLFPRVRSSSVFISLLLGAVLLIFPFLEQFRRLSEMKSINLLPDSAFFLAPHFDAFENFASAYENGFVSYGTQLLGCLLFFVPRSMWQEKPRGSGYALAHQLNYTFDNISMPWLGEGYVNFGIIGVFSFSVLIAFFMARLDSYYRSYNKISRRIDYDTTLYFYTIGAMFFLLRGDLTSSTAYILGGLFVAKLLVSRLGRWS